MSSGDKCPVLYFPHGGGPLPVLGDKSHDRMVRFLTGISTGLGRPASILLVSAHWESNPVAVTGSKYPGLLYDYYGFPEEAYTVHYDAPGNPKLAEQVISLLHAAGIESRNDEQRQFDHGMFVPLLLMYPDADIPCVQLSLHPSLDPDFHIRLGKAIAPLRYEGVLILGSGFSYHNLLGFYSSPGSSGDGENDAFQNWLIDACANPAVGDDERQSRLRSWETAPAARRCHPREDHLIPLHVCSGASSGPAEKVFDDAIMGKRAVAFLWRG